MEIINTLASVITFAMTLVSLIITWISALISVVMKYFNYVTSVVPRFMVPFIWLIVAVRLFKFIIKRNNTPSHSSYVNSGGNINNGSDS